MGTWWHMVTQWTTRGIGQKGEGGESETSGWIVQEKAGKKGGNARKGWRRELDRRGTKLDEWANRTKEEKGKIEYSCEGRRKRGETRNRRTDTKGERGQIEERGEKKGITRNRHMNSGWMEQERKKQRKAQDSEPLYKLEGLLEFIKIVCFDSDWHKTRLSQGPLY